MPVSCIRLRHFLPLSPLLSYTAPPHLTGPYRLSSASPGTRPVTGGAGHCAAAERSRLHYSSYLSGVGGALEYGLSQWRRWFLLGGMPLSHQPSFTSQRYRHSRLSMAFTLTDDVQLFLGSRRCRHSRMSMAFTLSQSHRFDACGCSLFAVGLLMQPRAVTRSCLMAHSTVAHVTAVCRPAHCVLHGQTRATSVR